MTPASLKSRAQAVAAASAIFEARIVAARILGKGDTMTDRALYRLEHEYWERADALAKPKKRRRRGK